MTLVLGWKNAGKVYLIADTAITVESTGEKLTKLTSERSAFGIQLIDSPNYQVNDYGRKINILSEDVAVACAGSVHSYLTFIRDLASRLKVTDISPIITINRLLNEYEWPGDFSMLLSIKFEAEPCLFTYNDIHGQQLALSRYEGQVVFAGNPSIEIQEMIAQWISGMAVNSSFSTHPDDALAMVCGFIQELIAINHLKIDSGIGGAVYGLFQNDNDIRWLKNVCYVLFDSRYQEHGFILTTRLYRHDEILLIRTEEDGETTVKIYPDLLDPNKPFDFEEQPFQEDYIIFLSVTRAKYALIRKSTNQAKKYIEFNGKQVMISPDLNNFLEQAHPLGYELAVGFGFF